MAYLYYSVFSTKKKKKSDDMYLSLQKYSGKKGYDVERKSIGFWRGKWRLG